MSSAACAGSTAIRRPSDSMTHTAAPTRTCSPSDHVGAAHPLAPTCSGVRLTTSASTRTSTYGTRTSSACPAEYLTVVTPAVCQSTGVAGHDFECYKCPWGAFGTELREDVTVVSGHDRSGPRHDCSRRAGAAPRRRSRRPVPRLRRRGADRPGDGRAANRVAHRARRAGRRAGRPGRHAARELARAGHQLLRRAEARRDPGARSTPPTRASSCATSSPTPALGSWSSRASLAARIAELGPTGTRDGPARSCRPSSWSGRPTASIIAARRPRTGRRSLAAGSDDAPPAAGSRPSDLACFIYTAGTTGPSKGCMLPHHYVVALAEQIARAWQRRPDDIVLTPLAALPLQRDLGLRRRHAAHRRERGDRPQVLGEPLLGRGEAHRRDDAVDARVARDPRRERRRTSPRQASHRLRLCAAAPMPPDTDRIWRERFGCATFSAGLRAHRGVADLAAPGGGAEQARRGGPAQRRRVRGPARRRRGPRGPGRRDRRDRRAGRPART